MATVTLQPTNPAPPPPPPPPKFPSTSPLPLTSVTRYFPFLGSRVPNELFAALFHGWKGRKFTGKHRSKSGGTRSGTKDAPFVGRTKSINRRGDFRRFFAPWNISHAPRSFHDCPAKDAAGLLALKSGIVSRRR